MKYRNRIPEPETTISGFTDNKEKKINSDRPTLADFLKFVFISAGASEFLPDLHFLCKIVLKPSNVIPLLLF
jgi:hypothetical protein